MVLILLDRFQATALQVELGSRAVCTQPWMSYLGLTSSFLSSRMRIHVKCFNAKMPSSAYLLNLSTPLPTLLSSSIHTYHMKSLALALPPLPPPPAGPPPPIRPRLEG